MKVENIDRIPGQRERVLFKGCPPRRSHNTRTTYGCRVGLTEKREKSILLQELYQYHQTLS